MRSVIEIKMDEVGYETYSSLEEAVKAFQHNIALENAVLDLDIGLLLESDVEPFSNYAMESITEIANNMKDSFLVSFIPWSKKFINVYFKMILDHLKKSTEMEPSLKKHLATAKSKLLELNKLENSVNSYNGKHGYKFQLVIPNIMKKLVWIQLSIQSIKVIGRMFHDTNSKYYGEKDPVKITETILKTINELLGTLYEVSKYEDDEKNFTHTLNALKRVNYDVTKLFGHGEIRQNDSTKDVTLEEYKSVAKKLENDMISSSESTKELSLKDAWVQCREEMILFIKLVENNQWNVVKFIKGAETTRRNLILSLSDKMSKDSSVNKDQMTILFNKLTSLGTVMTHTNNNISKLYSSLSGDINKMFTAVTAFQNSVIKNTNNSNTESNNSKDEK